MAGHLSIWTIYERPSDYPVGFIARRFEIRPEGARPTHDIKTSDDLTALRKALAVMGLSAIGRESADDPNIVESWL